MTHELPVHVYYEDTDLAGIVYYANYLRFIERGRTEWVRTLGVDQTRLKAEGVVFAVRRVEADYLAPAQFADDLIVTTQATGATAARLIVWQKVLRGQQVLFTARVTLVALSNSGAPVRLPGDMRQKIAAQLG